MTQRDRELCGLGKRLSAVAMILCLAALAGGCRDSASQPPPTATAATRPADRTVHIPRPTLARRPREYKVVHVFVSLCDNRNQGIVPVPEALGDGQDPKNNLYWGAMYGVKTFFGRSDLWSVVRHVTVPSESAVLDRAVFRSIWAGAVIYVIADAYDGARMKVALTDFFEAAAGVKHIEVAIDRESPDGSLQGGALADLVCFVGHNGLMEVSLDRTPRPTDSPNPTGAIVLACKSFPYFSGPLKDAGCPLLLGTTGLMAPEAYTLSAALRSWAQGQTPQEIRKAAAGGYAKYQRCSTAAALRLFTTGR